MPRPMAYAIVTGVLALSATPFASPWYLLGSVPIILPAPKKLTYALQLAFNTVSADIEGLFGSGKGQSPALRPLPPPPRPRAGPRRDYVDRF